MKMFAVASGLLGIVIFAFLAGVMLTSGGLMMLGFCMWSPAIGLWGYALGRMRIKVTLDDPRKAVRR